MLKDGLILMGVGMGTVFSFLVILWFAVFLMSKAVIRLNEIFPEKIKNVVPIKAIKDDVEIAIAIAAAKLR